jgi:excisionase family DNA binding protein
MPGEAARILGVSTKQVGNLVDAGKLHGKRTDGGHRRICLASVTALGASPAIPDDAETTPDEAPRGRGPDPCNGDAPGVLTLRARLDPQPV